MCCVLGLFFYLGGQNETRLGSVITRFTVGGSGFPSSRSGCQVGAIYYLFEPRSRERRGWLSRLTTGSPSALSDPTKVRWCSDALPFPGGQTPNHLQTT